MGDEINSKIIYSRERIIRKPGDTGTVVSICGRNINVGMFSLEVHGSILVH